MRDHPSCADRLDRTKPLPIRWKAKAPLPHLSPRLALCEAEHSAFKRSASEWSASAFVGIQPLRHLLGECLHGPIWDSMVIRSVSFGIGDW